MKKNLRIVLAIVLILGIVLAIFLPVYYLIIEQPKTPFTDNYIYPKPLWNASIISDMVVENDNKTHFCFSNTDTNFGYDRDLIYTR